MVRPDYADDLPVANALAPELDLQPSDLVVLRFLADGLPDKAIALRLGVSVHTVHKRVREVLRKMSSSSRTKAAIKAFRRGLI